MSETRCSTCKALIVWGRSASTGRPVPLDPAERRVLPGCFDLAPGVKLQRATVVTDEGRVVSGLDVDSDVGREIVEKVPELAQAIVVGRVTHFSSCPNAAAHRGKRRPS